MATFFSFLKQHKIPERKTLTIFLSRPLTWYGVVLYVLIAAMLIIAYILVLDVNNHFLVTVPARGGVITEGVIGAPRFINPVLATTETDTSITNLVFSGLVHKEADGSITPVLAESYVVSPDGLTYTFTLRDKLKWSDGKALTSDDVAFTISKLADPAVHPDPYWQNIHVATSGPSTVIFTLPAPAPDFLNHATVGIIPSHIWSTIHDEVFANAPENLIPTASGPYTFLSMKNQNGIPQTLVLTRNRHYALHHSLIDQYKMIFFANQTQLLDALNSKSIDFTLDADPVTATSVQSSAYTFDKITSPYAVQLLHLESDTSFDDQALLAILNQAIDKRGILATVEHGYGILPGISTETTLSQGDALTQIQTLGYAFDGTTLQKNNMPVAVSFAVEDDPTMLAAARSLASQFETFGIHVTVQAFDLGTFQKGIGAHIFPWFLGNVRTDAPLDNYVPVLTLYTKAYPFIHRKALHLALPEYIDSPADLYDKSEDWYIRTNNIWKIFLSHH